MGKSIGPNTAKVAETILEQRPHPEQGFRSCLGIFRLSKEYGQDRAEAAWGKVVALASCSYKSVKSILKRNLDRIPVETPDEATLPPHDNIRGAGYYIQGGDNNSC